VHLSLPLDFLFVGKQKTGDHILDTTSKAARQMASGAVSLTDWIRREQAVTDIYAS
jgi:hypothetical protein